MFISPNQKTDLRFIVSELPIRNEEIKEKKKNQIVELISLERC